MSGAASGCFASGRQGPNWPSWTPAASRFEAGRFETVDQFAIKGLELVELLALGSGEAPLTEESQGACRLRLVGGGIEKDLPFADAQRARLWIDELMARSRCEL